MSSSSHTHFVWSFLSTVEQCTVGKGTGSQVVQTHIALSWASRPTTTLPSCCTHFTDRSSWETKQWTSSSAHFHFLSQPFLLDTLPLFWNRASTNSLLPVSTHSQLRNLIDTHRILHGHFKMCSLIWIFELLLPLHFTFTPSLLPCQSVRGSECVWSRACVPAACQIDTVTVPVTLHFL